MDRLIRRLVSAKDAGSSYLSGESTHLERLERIVSDWDDFVDDDRDRPPTDAAVASARHLLSILEEDTWPWLFVCPDRSGGLDIEVEGHRRSATFAVLPTGRIDMVALVTFPIIDAVACSQSWARSPDDAELHMWAAWAIAPELAGEAPLSHHSGGTVCAACGEARYGAAIHHYAHGLMFCLCTQEEGYDDSHWAMEDPPYRLNRERLALST